MSQAKLHKLSIKQRKPGISVGANTIVELDGKPLPYVHFLKLEFHSRRVTKVLMEMYVEVEEIDIDTPLAMQEVVAKSKNFIDMTYSSEEALKQEATSQKDQTSSLQSSLDEEKDS